jgi:hypothetical protein
MSTNVTVTVRIAFATDPLADVPTWTDVSAYAYELNIKRGRQHELGRIEAGTATVMLKNNTGVFWPGNAAGPYYGYILPGKRINIRATYGVTTYDLFTGFIESWVPQWSGKHENGAVMRVQCSDALKLLATYELNNAGYASETTDVRIGNVLDDIGFPAADRDLDTGQTTLPASGALVAENAMNHLRDVQDAEQSIIFIAGDGHVQFHSRHHRLLNEYASAAAFGDDAGESMYVDLSPSLDDTYIYNDVRMTRSGGTEQAVSDATSQTAYGPRTHAQTGLLLTADTEALAMAQWLLSQYKDPAMRVSGITVWPDKAAADLFPKALGYDIGERITVRLDHAYVNEDYHIEGVRHDYSRGGVWKTQWQLGNADSVTTYWLIGRAGYSEMGDTTRLAY